MKLDLTKPLSAAALARTGTCAEQVALVRQHFGSRPLRLTRTLLRQAARLGLEMDWLADHLPPEQQRVYDAARGEAERVFDAARAEAWRVSYYAIDEAERAFYDATADALADALGLP